MRNPLNGQPYTFGQATTLAEAGSVQLEYMTLARLTGNETYSNVAKRSLDALLRVPRAGVSKASDVLPIDVHPTLNRFASTHAIPRLLAVKSLTDCLWLQESDRRSIGASGDSYYEYLLKLWIASRQSNDQDQGWRNRLLQQYVKAVDSITKEMVGRAGGRNNYVFLGTRASGGSAVARSMEHLACFAPGMLALGESRRRAKASLCFDHLFDPVCRWFCGLIVVRVVVRCEYG